MCVLESVKQSSMPLYWGPWKRGACDYREALGTGLKGLFRTLLPGLKQEGAYLVTGKFKGAGVVGPGAQPSSEIRLCCC